MTAKLVGEDVCTQGVVIRTTPEGKVIVKGESGTEYLCEPDYVVVPLKDMWGSARQFAVSMGVVE